MKDTTRCPTTLKLSESLPVTVTDTGMGTPATLAVTVFPEMVTGIPVAEVMSEAVMIKLAVADEMEVTRTLWWYRSFDLSM